ncbi:MAG: restriction endonuclease subunit S [Anaerolineales bacterium]|nr:restriction endonuclease subunit S [Anaerolineales bacterium]
MTFKNIAFGDLCEEIYRYPSYYGIDYVESGIPEIRGELIQNNGTIDLNIENWRFIDTVTADRFPRTTLREDDLVMSVRGTIGKVALIPHQLDGANMTANLLRISPNRSIVFPRYLWSYMRSDYFGQVLDHISPSTTIKTIRVPDLKQVDVPLPPLAEQQRIAAILDKADGLRAKRRAALAKLDTLLQATFLDMFGDPVSNPMGWEEMELYKTAKKFSDGPFGSNLKTAHYTESGIQVIRLQNVGIGYLDESDKAYISEEHFQSLPRHHCYPGDIIVGTMGDPNLRACIIPAHIEKCLNKADCVQYRVNPQIMNQDYACWLLNNPRTIKKASKLSLGQTRLRISMGRLKQLVVPVPPIDKQVIFSNTVRKHENQKYSQETSLKHLDNLFHSLQQRAFKGEL